MIHNPSNLYTGGSVVFNSQPEVNLYAQLMARKQAKDEAIDEYYRKLPSTLNSAGMREQSIPGLNQAVNELTKYWMQNKGQIKKGTTPEAFNFDKIYREIQQKINEDKNAAKTDLELGKMRFSKENGYIFKDRGFIDKLTQHGLSVFDPNHKSIDLGTVTIPVKPFDIKDQEEYYKAITSGMEAGKKYDYSKQYTNPQTGQVIVPTIDVLNDDQIGKAAQKAMELVSSDESKQEYFENILHSPNKADWQKLQDAYSKYFKGDVDTPEKAAAADAIIKLSIPKKYAEEQESNWQQKNQAAINKIYLQDNLIRGRKTIGDAGVDFGDYDILGKYEKNVKSKKVSIIIPVSGGKTRTEEKTLDIIPANEVDKTHKEMIGVSPIFENGESYYIRRANGDWEGNNGQVISATVVAQKELDKVSLNELRRGRQNLNPKLNIPKTTGNKKKVYNPATGKFE